MDPDPRQPGDGSGSATQIEALHKLGVTPFLANTMFLQIGKRCHTHPFQRFTNFSHITNYLGSSGEKTFFA
jgi:hypothetical protein